MALSPKLQLPAVARLASKANLMLACLGPGICAQGSPHYVFNLHHLNLYGQINHTWYANSFAFKMKQGKDMFSEIKLTAAKIFFPHFNKLCGSHCSNTQKLSCKGPCQNHTFSSQSPYDTLPHVHRLWVQSHCTLSARGNYVQMLASWLSLYLRWQTLSDLTSRWKMEISTVLRKFKFVLCH